MPLVVWKFEFEVIDEPEIEMPVGAKVLSVGTQRPRMICLWAACDPKAAKERRNFHVRGTGHPLNCEGPFIGSVLDGPFVWHIFGKN